MGNLNILKNKMDKLVEIYETPEFILDDPIQFPHLFASSKQQELVGFISSLLAYGQRKQFNLKLEDLFIRIMDKDPINYVKNFEPKSLGNFNYRFSKTIDFITLFAGLKDLYNNSKGIKELFEYGYKQGNMLSTVVMFFYNFAIPENTSGFYHLLPNPKANGAMKRMRMFLRWMVRDGVVDLGLWKFISPSELKIPLDIHVGNTARKYGLLNLKSNNNKAVEELTAMLRQFDSNDPIKYDFALFGLGVQPEKTKEKESLYNKEPLFSNLS